MQTYFFQSPNMIISTIAAASYLKPLNGFPLLKVLEVAQNCQQSICITQTLGFSNHTDPYSVPVLTLRSLTTGPLHMLFPQTIILSLSVISSKILFFFLPLHSLAGLSLCYRSA